MEDDLKISKVEKLRNHRLEHTQILNSSLGDQTKLYNAYNEDDLQRKMTSSGRKPQNIKQTMSRSSSNLKLKLREPNQN